MYHNVRSRWATSAQLARRPPPIQAIALLALVMALWGCASQERAQEATRKAYLEFNVGQIMVESGGMNEPHKVLGQIMYNEPFSPDAIETTHINDKLRQLAIAKYGDDVDAIINVASDINRNGTTVSASGQAIEIIGACTFCRHKQKIEVSEYDPQARVVQPPRYDVGESWVLKVNNNEGRISVISVSPYKVVMNSLGHQNVYTGDGNLVTGYLYGERGDFAPNLGTLSYPLKVGKRWSAEWTLKTESGKLLGTTHGWALDWEPVTVPLGTFDALKVKIKYMTSVFGLQMVCWYAPDVKIFAKCETSHPDFKDIELLSYKPSTDTLTR